MMPGNVNRFQDFNGMKMEHYLSSAIALIPFLYQLATRGIMVERGLIDIDEVDMGWIISTAAKEGPKWQSGGTINLGLLFLFSPIAAAAGYLQSSSENNDEFLKIKELPAITQNFIENTTPEDTVNIVSMLHEIDNHIYPRSSTIGLSLPESVNDLLESEINLFDFYRMHSGDNFLFKELHEGYPVCFGEGLSAFSEAINEGVEMSSAITHTYINLMSIFPDSKVLQSFGKETALKIRQKAKNIIENGGYLTTLGKNMTTELDEYFKNSNECINPKITADLTANVTFLATLSGVRP